MTHHARAHTPLWSAMPFTHARRVVPWLVAVACAGCHTWQAAPLPAGLAVRWDMPVRVVLSNGEGFEFDSARVMRDTVYGTPHRVRVDSIVAIPVSRIVRMEARQLSEGRSFTVALVAVVSVLAVAIASIAITFGSFGGD